MERNIVKDRSGDRKYFTQVPRIVWMLARSPYDLSLWFTIKDVAGEDMECDLTTKELATLSMMSVGKVCECRSYLIEKGLLAGELKGTDGRYQVWHLWVPDLWKRNVAETIDVISRKKRIKYKENQLSLALVQSSPGESFQSSPGESCPTPGESCPTPGESLPLIEKTINKNLSNNLFENANWFDNFLSFWNSLDIIVHTIAPRDEKAGSGRRTFVEAVSSRLSEGHDWDALKTAAKNYADILHSDQHRFKFRWTITQFLNRGFDQFLDRKTAWENYKKSNFDSYADQQAQSLAFYRKACEIDQVHD